MRDVVNSSGAVVTSYEFSEYGQRISPANSGGVESQKTWVGGASVQDEVADTGLMMMGHRFYDPSGPGGGTGRFLNRDPIGFAGGLNLFEYTGNPVQTTDPAGLQSNTPEIWSPPAKLTFHADDWHAWLEYQIHPDWPTVTMGSWPGGGYRINYSEEVGRPAQASATFWLTPEMNENFLLYVSHSTQYNWNNNCAAWAAGAWESIGAGPIRYKTWLGTPAPWIIRDFTLGNGAGGAQGLSLTEHITSRYYDVYIRTPVLKLMGLVSTGAGTLTKGLGRVGKSENAVQHGREAKLKRPANLP